MTVADKLMETLTTLKKFEVDIGRALMYGEHGYDFDDVVLGCMSGKFDLFTLPNSVIVMDLQNYPQHTAYHVFIVCGDMGELMQAQATWLLDEARMRGATRLTFAGRKGWLRQLETHGWVPTVVAMKKELPNGEDIKNRDKAGGRPSSGEELQAELQFGPSDSGAGLSAVHWA